MKFSTIVFVATTLVASLVGAAPIPLKSRAAGVQLTPYQDHNLCLVTTATDGDKLTLAPCTDGSSHFDMVRGQSKITITDGAGDYCVAADVNTGSVWVTPCADSQAQDFFVTYDNRVRYRNTNQCWYVDDKEGGTVGLTPCVLFHADQAFAFPYELPKGTYTDYPN